MSRAPSRHFRSSVAMFTWVEDSTIADPSLEQFGAPSSHSNGTIDVAIARWKTPTESAICFVRKSPLRDRASASRSSGSNDVVSLDAGDDRAHSESSPPRTHRLRERCIFTSPQVPNSSQALLRAAPDSRRTRQPRTRRDHPGLAPVPTGHRSRMHHLVTEEPAVPCLDAITPR
jgi:hypothetical protein